MSSRPSTPMSSPRDEEVLTVPTFTNKIKTLKVQFDILTKAVKELADPKVKIIMINNQEVTAEQLRSYNKEFLRSLDNLVKDYRRAVKGKKRAIKTVSVAGRNVSDRRRGVGIESLLYVDSNVVEFFRNSGLTFENGTPITADNGLIMFKQDTYGLTNASQMVKLFSMYTKKNNLKILAKENEGKDENKMNGQLIGADRLLVEHFRKTFDMLAREKDIELRDKGLVPGQPKPGAKRSTKTGQYPANQIIRRFDPTNFLAILLPSKVWRKHITKESVNLTLPPRDEEAFRRSIQPFLPDVSLIGKKKEQWIKNHPIDYQNLARGATGDVNVEVLSKVLNDNENL